MNADMLRKQKYALMDVALGKAHADRALVGGKIVNVYTMEVYRADIAIKGKRIAYVGDAFHTIGPNTDVIDVSDKYLLPGLIETHMHAGGSQLSMTEFGKLALMHGTLSIVTDIYEVGIITGKQGLRFCLNELKQTGIRPVFVVPMPAYHQNEAFENLGTFTLEDALEVLSWPDCYGLNEVNLSKLYQRDRGVETLVLEAERQQKLTIGHAAALSGKELQAALNFLSSTGDHECVTWEDANEKARLGMTIQLREGSVGSNITDVIAAKPNHLNTIGDFAFSTDEIAPDLMTEGHMDIKLRMAIQAGADPLLAIRAGTLNAARMLRMEHEIGSLTPGKWADILTVDDLEELKIGLALVNGEVLVSEGCYIKEIEAPIYPAFFSDSMNIDLLPDNCFKIKAPGKGAVTVRVIEACDGSLFSKATQAVMQPENGFVEADESHDILKIAHLDRHQRSGRMGIGFIKGFGIKGGAIASSYNPCTENLSVMGTNDRDMVVAANYVIEKKGGFVVAKDGEVICALELPLAGILSELPFDQVASKLKEVHGAVEALGCVIDNPFHILAFMVFPAHFGELKLCTYGLIDVDKVEVVDLFLP